MLIGVTPFYNRNKNLLLMKIKNSKVIFPDKTKYKIDYSDELVDFISKVTLFPSQSISYSKKIKLRDWGMSMMEMMSFLILSSLISNSTNST